MMKRTCRTCKIEKPLTDFVRHVTATGGYEHTCKSCHNERRRAGPSPALIAARQSPISDSWANPVNLGQVSRENLRQEFEADSPEHRQARLARARELIARKPKSYLARHFAEIYKGEL